MTTRISITIPDDMRDRLDQVATLRDQETADLIRTALDDYLTREIDIINATAQGMEDVKAGRTVAHDDVMAEARDIIAAARAKQKKSA